MAGGEHVTRERAPKIVRECDCALTGVRCVTTIFTDLAVIDVTPGGLVLREVAPGWSVEEIQAMTEPRLHVPSPPATMAIRAG